MPTRPWRPCIRQLAAGVLLLASFWNGNPAAEPPDTAPEYPVKAAFLQHFIRYVTWPAKAFPSEDSPVEICILGKDPFGDAIDRLVEGRELMGRRIEVRRVTLEEAAGGCHVVFMGREEGALLTHRLRALRTRPILTVTESPKALSAGAMINFVMEGNSLRYEVNLDATEESGLKLATPMLVSAKRVIGRQPEARESR
jgi:hypothetical protein